jgi:hypothetical protein
MTVTVTLVVEMQDNVDPVSAARAFSELPKVHRVMSVVDGRPMEMWSRGEHLASEMDHPRVKRTQRLLEERDHYREESDALYEANARTR